MRKAMNEVLRDWYVGDCAAGVARWNRMLERHGMSDRLTLPGPQVQPRDRHVLRLHFDPDGHPLSQEEWDAARTSGCRPTTDRAFLQSLMSKPVYEAGKFANYIAPPAEGINRLPVDFEYVRTDG